jgi:hypothetical protein
LPVETVKASESIARNTVDASVLWLVLRVGSLAGMFAGTSEFCCLAFLMKYWSKYKTKNQRRRICRFGKIIEQPAK